MFQHGVVVASFDGKEYGSDYLTVQKGDKVLVHAAWRKDGWDMAAQRCKTEPWFGWIPCAYWKVCDEIMSPVLAQPEIVPFLAIPRLRLHDRSYRLCLGHDLRNLLCVSIGLGSQVVTAVHHVEQTLKCRMLTALSQRFPSRCAKIRRTCQNVAVPGVAHYSSRDVVALSRGVTHSWAVEFWGVDLCGDALYE